MSIEQVIEKKLNDSLIPEYLEILNESHNHNVPANSETHFKVVAVSKQFEGVRAVGRHQKVYAELADELQGGVHALALHLYTPDEWAETHSAPDSPLCMGGGKKD